MPSIYVVSVVVGLCIKGVYLHILNMCPFDYMAVAETGKVGPVNRLTKPVGFLKLLQLDVLSWSAIDVYSNILGVFLCCHLTFLTFLVV